MSEPIRLHRGGTHLGLLLALLLGSPALAAAFSSGSTGALGALAPTTNIVVPLPPDGILNYTTVTIPAGVTVTVAPNVANTPVTLLATGDVTIAGTLDVSGTTGPQMSQFATPGGPGGFPGGVGGSPPTGGAGPGGGAPTGSGNSNATYGAPASFVSLVPLFGGSGGGGGVPSSLGATGGGGGGGALVLASSTQIRVTGTISANGGAGGQSPAGTGFTAGGGSGGAIRLVAPQITGTGQLTATGGGGTDTLVLAGPGGIRLEATTLSFTGTSNPPASTSTALGPVAPASSPPLVNLPTLTITAVNDLAAPAHPTGSTTSADVRLPQGTTNPVTVTLAIANISVGTTVSVLVLPPNAAATTMNSTALTRTVASATATASVTLPASQLSLLMAVATFPLPPLASRDPRLDGEPEEPAQVTAMLGGPSTVTRVPRASQSSTR